MDIIVTMKIHYITTRPASDSFEHGLLVGTQPLHYSEPTMILSKAFTPQNSKYYQMSQCSAHMCRGQHVGIWGIIIRPSSLGLSNYDLYCGDVVP